MTYDEAMNKYGSDKPDTRFDMLLTDVSDIVKDTEFKVFSSAVENGGVVKAINVKGGAGDYSERHRRSWRFCLQTTGQRDLPG